VLVQRVPFRNKKSETHTSVIPLAALCLASERRTGDAAPIKHGSAAHSRESGNPVCHLSFWVPASAGTSAGASVNFLSARSRRADHGELRSRADPDHAAVLDEVMTKIPVEQVTPGLKAHMAEVILKAAAQGQTSYDGLLASASDQIQTVLSLLT
jgi:hypothetical protein